MSLDPRCQQRGGSLDENEEQVLLAMEPEGAMPHFRRRGSSYIEPNDFADLAVLARTLNEFERRYNEVAEPSDWRFTRAAVAELMARLARNEPCLRLAARTS